MSHQRVLIIEKIDEAGAVALPTKATKESACFDLQSAEDVELSQDSVKMVRTGIRARPPEGTFIEIRPRSGLSSKGVVIVNAPGTVDRDYALEIKVLMTYLFNGSYKISAGDRIAQLRLVEEVDTAIEWGKVTPQGERKGGFGSTGK